MSFVTAALIGAGGAVVGGYLANKGAQSQADAAQRAADLQKQMFDTQNAQQAPYRQTGYNALNQIGQLGSGTYGIYGAGGDVTGQGTGSGYLTHQFSPEDFQAGIDPGYAFRLQQGQRALQAQQNQAGGLIGGNALTAMQDYTQGQASQEYGNAFNRYNTQRSNIYNTLASMAGLGQTSLGQTMQGSTTAGGNIGTNLANVGTALGGGQVAMGGALSNAANQFGNYQYLGKLLAARNPAIQAPSGYGTVVPQTQYDTQA